MDVNEVFAFTADSSTGPYDSVMMDSGGQQQGPGKKQRLQSDCQLFGDTRTTLSSPGLETARNDCLFSMATTAVSHAGPDPVRQDTSTNDATRWWFSHSTEHPGMVLSEHLGSPSDAVESLSYNSSNWSLSRLHSPQGKGSEKHNQKLCKQAQSRVRRALLTGN